MLKQILIEEIKIDRELREGDDLSDLNAGQTQPPIVVNENYELIDGLRRIRQAEGNGASKITAYVVSSLEEVADALAEQHTTPVRDWTRVYELVRAIHPYVTKRWLSIRRNNIRKATGREPAPLPSYGPSRPLVIRALGGTSSSQWEVVERCFEGGIPPEMLEEVKAGRLTPSGAFNRAHRQSKQGEGDVTNPLDQQALVASVAQFMVQAVRALDRLSWPISANPQDLAESIEQIRKSRTKITSFLNRQSEEAGSK